MRGSTNGAVRMNKWPMIQRYDAWYEAFDVCPKMQIDGDQLDFVDNEENLSVILDMIQEKLADVRSDKQAGNY